MTEEKIEIEQEVVETFTDELSDEALDREEGGRACCPCNPCSCQSSVDSYWR